MPRFDTYRGFLFASLSSDVPTLEDYLGDARPFLDIVADQAPQGLEYVPGTVTYTFDANWKLQFENGLDYYHFVSTHSSYIDVLGRRGTPTEIKSRLAALLRETSPDRQGSFSFRNGHSVMWSIRGDEDQLRPLAYDTDDFEALQANIAPHRLQWMLRQRNLTIFPNLQIIDISSLQLRTWRPLAPDRTEMHSHCLEPIGEAAKARELRIRQYEDFFNLSGMATSDDNVMYEYCQSGYEARDAGWTQGYARGLGSDRGALEHSGDGFSFSPQDWREGDLTFGETCFHTGYREWLRLLSQAGDLRNV
ncbi:aromatic ring-hydroxylating dioxygenase subunit alpha [Mesorhizobium sp. CA8]|uniref:RHO alpha subunit C-terminal catalytic domain-containing protein n=1 Tax=unclassified Mesorhizobium TaxID=325217 RepID=UPI001CCAD54E|nr:MULTISPECIES: RHO alpha subunit C-terminal catalytic domain-containing protein [unclassified Mesorhizobium]MBZ9761675.1 aromatic ring-hydroxylating dioxygenase subunit alpha [Mesorhizobium sp. CA8]MBZ9820571.1 aromatic ring-hydroxylating dioxygenase subunit alpha [Mesorhizobium sp. CA4]